MTSPIIDFIEARLEEDFDAATAAGGKEWRQYDPLREHGRIKEVGGDVVTYDEGAPTEGQAVHIARHDPARVLREVAAKRALLLDFTDELRDAERHQDIDMIEAYTRLLGVLAAIYSDHPDYREEWAA